MNFILKPKVTMHGKSLKKWYRRVYLVVSGYQILPASWVEHPSVEVPANKLEAVMNSLYKQSIF